MHFYTYKITNLINGKIYVGVHKTLDLNDGYMGSGKILKRSISKHGIENFKKDILMIHDSEEEMFEIESLIVDQDFVDRKDTYNLKLGGQGGFDYINFTGKNLYGYNGKHKNSIAAFSQTAKDHHLKMSTNVDYYVAICGRISNSLKMRYDTTDHPWKGRRHKLESIEKAKKTFSETNHQQGEKNSQFGKMWIHSIKERKSTRINKNDPIPEGWTKGRKMFS